ncbi:hypothetical protein SELMODRAFT_432139 [Selaginella moellendorffii]|uniref:PHD-type domain-containing protein n=1 Tax=Selaginella moellendorffii TaxID=88036 RepID=D8TF35_SELML|nr:PHD finger protein ALFIN-LIKE 6 isoform X2 [Selaginella moellendorffii]EFJ04726.1 hypothetical protein SELMODRAFT_432139 [Selaginella moellendorffii]|eukprot:XP_002994221.1 PHD finger protein ALFIN-LIKE 6 isoform X2 [Selaginella moellendorffii]
MESPATVEAIFEDFRGRREGIVKALTTDVSIFCDECDPVKDLCLYGLPDGEWKVTLPVEEVPPELPEPSLGINFAKDGMKRTDWLILVAVHSDSWLYSVAFYHAARLHKADRQRLFGMINNLPTIHEVLAKPANKSSSKPKSKKAARGSSNNSNRRRKKEEDEDEEEEEQDEEEVEENSEEEEEEAFCGICADPHNTSQFWIACDSCRKWYHGSCVKVNASKAAGIKSYNCPSCAKKRARH